MRFPRFSKGFHIVVCGPQLICFGNCRIGSGQLARGASLWTPSHPPTHARQILGFTSCFWDPGSYFWELSNSKRSWREGPPFGPPPTRAPTHPHAFCPPGLEYSANGLSATFECKGTTLDYSCNLLVR